MKDYASLIGIFATAPDSQLDKAGAKMCAEWDGNEPVRFVRDLLDLCVRYAWGSGFVVSTLAAILENEPDETDEEAEARRQALLAKWEPESSEPPPAAQDSPKDTLVEATWTFQEPEHRDSFLELVEPTGMDTHIDDLSVTVSGPKSQLEAFISIAGLCMGPPQSGG